MAFTGYNVGQHGGNAVTITDKSGTITAGETAQALLAINNKRIGFWIQNTSEGDLWISDVGTAEVAGSSLKLAVGSVYESPMMGCTSGAVSIYGATTGQSFACREYSKA